MYLTRLIYCSRTKGLGPEVIEDILRQARAENAKQGVTGILLFNADFFLQCLEGGRESVNKIYHRILADPRHESPVILNYEEVDQRCFASWDMGYVGWHESYRRVIMEYSGSDNFDPYKMGGSSTLKLLLALKEKIG
jgi:hypothetical protein